MSGLVVRGEQARAESVDVMFALGSHTYRLRRPRALWNSIYHEEPIRTEEARALIAEAVQQHGNDAALVRLLQIAAPRLGRVDEETGLVLMRLRLRESRPQAVAARAYTPPAPRPAPAPPAQSSVEEPVMSPEIAAAQAAALKEAAELGVPFCEECARAAAREAAAASPG